LLVYTVPHTTPLYIQSDTVPYSIGYQRLALFLKIIQKKLGFSK
jgi:hypothetical protein